MEHVFGSKPTCLCLFCARLQQEDALGHKLSNASDREDIRSAPVSWFGSLRLLRDPGTDCWMGFRVGLIVTFCGLSHNGGKSKGFGSCTGFGVFIIYRAERVIELNCLLRAFSCMWSAPSAYLVVAVCLINRLTSASILACLVEEALNVYDVIEPLLIFLIINFIQKNPLCVSVAQPVKRNKFKRLIVTR